MRINRLIKVYFMNIINNSHNQTVGNNRSLIFKRLIVWLPIIFMYMVIFGFSSQNGEQSGGLSRKVAGVIVDTADRLNIIEVTEDNRDIYIENCQFPIRKTAHMTEYAILGMLVLTALIVDGVILKFSLYLSVFITFLLACTDEFHQLFVPDRSGQFTDVLIDITGCIIGVVIYYFIFSLIKNKNNNKK